jgi:hypothetical protein
MLLRSLLFLWACAAAVEAAGCCGVTNDAQGGGRFGDKLLTYLRAKWISHRYQIPFFYQPFDHSQKLVLHEKERRFQKGSYAVEPLSIEALERQEERRAAYVWMCPYFPFDRWEIEKYGYQSFDVDWKDPAFRKSVLRLLAPRTSLPLIRPPADTVNIALHIREGGSVDDAATRARLPLKFPPLEFYQEALSYIVAKYPGRQILCHLFTDAADPSRFIAPLEKALASSGDRVRFAYRQEKPKDLHVLADFFSLFHFDCLIRPQSNFSIIPSLLHDYAIVYAPVRFAAEGERVEIKEVAIEIDPARYEASLSRTRLLVK